MKKFHSSQFVLVFVLALMSFYACSKDSDSPVDPNNVTNSNAALTLNGSGYSNKSITLGNGACSYYPAENITVVQFSGKVDSDSLFFVFQFIGNTTGTHHWRSSEPDGLIIKSGSSGFSYFYADSTGSTTVNSYGAVNGKVEGTIAGKLIEASSSSELNISNGSFSALRIPDSN